VSSLRSSISANIEPLPLFHGYPSSVRIDAVHSLVSFNVPVHSPPSIDTIMFTGFLLSLCYGYILQARHFAGDYGIYWELLLSLRYVYILRARHFAGDYGIGIGS
jgi:hypothetical protein